MASPHADPSARAVSDPTEAAEIDIGGAIRMFRRSLISSRSDAR
jgi:hypothetical protein